LDLYIYIELFIKQDRHKNFRQVAQHVMSLDDSHHI
jgi:hypothetical protein